ncbi:MAG TPA: methylenetetrahydrofolate reductase [NAD(P)H] [Phycisphaerales bacterium]|nr:methylenetetrahydrofolate reductase [NAD(P)H] [Phycisphaerales bacterium]
MHIRDILKLRQTTFSFEFFPPKTDKAAGELFEAVRELEPLHPSWVSVTYGAGGGTRTRTNDLVVKIKQTTALDPMPHLTCIYHTEAEIYDILEKYAGAGVSNILALGGDPPRDMPNYDRSRDAFRYASQLVRFIREFRERHAGKSIGDPRGFGIGVAGFPEGHPGTPNRLDEIDLLKAKIDEGADFVITQLFFENRDFYDFRERCEIAGITAPIIAGVMPITSLSGMKAIAGLALGARIPARLLRAVDRCKGNAEAIRRVGVHWATEQCRDLLDHQVRGIHFYTLNRSTATRDIYANLGFEDSLSVA